MGRPFKLKVERDTSEIEYYLEQSLTILALSKELFFSNKILDRKYSRKKYLIIYFLLIRYSNEYSIKPNNFEQYSLEELGKVFKKRYSNLTYIHKQVKDALLLNNKRKNLNQDYAEYFETLNTLNYEYYNNIPQY